MVKSSAPRVPVASREPKLTVPSIQYEISRDPAVAPSAPRPLPVNCATLIERLFATDTRSLTKDGKLSPAPMLSVTAPGLPSAASRTGGSLATATAAALRSALVAGMASLFAMPFRWLSSPGLSRFTKAAWPAPAGVALRATAFAPAVLLVLRAVELRRNDSSRAPIFRDCPCAKRTEESACAPSRPIALVFLVGS